MFELFILVVGVVVGFGLGRKFYAGRAFGPIAAPEKAADTPPASPK